MVQVEQVGWVVASLDLDQPVVVAAVRGPYAVLTVVLHHHVDVAAAGRAGMQLLPVLLRPAAAAGRFAGSGSMPATTATQPPLRYAKAVASSGTLAAAPLIGYMCIVDSGVGIVSPYRRCIGDGVVGDLLEEVGLPIPLQSLGHAGRRRRLAAPSTASALARPTVDRRSRVPEQAPRRPDHEGRSSTTRRCRRSATRDVQGNGAAAGIWVTPIHAAQLVRQRREQVPIPPEEVLDIRDVVQHRSADDHAVLTDRMAAERERGDDPEVAAASSQRPEQSHCASRRSR